MDSNLSPFEVLIKSDTVLRNMYHKVDSHAQSAATKTYIKVVFAKLAATHRIELKHAAIKNLLDELTRPRLEDVSHEEPIADADEEMTDIAPTHVSEPDAPTSNSIGLIQACTVFLQTMVKVDDKVPANALDILYRCVASGIRKPARVRSVKEVVTVFYAVASDAFYAAKTVVTYLNLLGGHPALTETIIRTNDVTFDDFLLALQAAHSWSRSRFPQRLGCLTQTAPDWQCQVATGLTSLAPDDWHTLTPKVLTQIKENAPGLRDQQAYIIHKYLQSVPRAVEAKLCSLDSTAATWGQSNVYAPPEFFPLPPTLAIEPISGTTSSPKKGYRRNKSMSKIIEGPSSGQTHADIVSHRKKLVPKSRSAAQSME
ncbi:hypothetical protein E4T43_02311 [Aureobasidium subglaciale]|nr:hypothetical protein E4T43_02311 [Aureobasidium subglaciale]